MVALGEKVTIRLAIDGRRLGLRNNHFSLALYLKVVYPGCSQSSSLEHLIADIMCKSSPLCFIQVNIYMFLGSENYDNLKDFFADIIAEIEAACQVLINNN